jgi:hypothetical protein
MITSEPSASAIVAPVRSAMERTTSAPAALSPLGTTAQEGQGLPGGRPGRCGERRLGNGALGSGHHGGLLGGQVGGEGIMEFFRIHRELYGRLPALPRRVLKLDQGCVQDAVLRGAFNTCQGFALVRGEGGDVDQADDVVGVGGGVGEHRAAP